MCSALERSHEAIEHVRRAQELDPLTHRIDLVTEYLRAGQYDKAIQSGHLAVELGPSDARARATLGWGYFLAGDVAKGLSLLEDAVRLTPGNNLWLAQLGQVYGMAGLTEKAREILDQLKDKSKVDYVAPYHFAYVYTGLGLQNEAIEQLEEAYEKRAGAVYGMKGSFLFRTLHDHPRFTALLRRMNLA